LPAEIGKIARGASPEIFAAAGRSAGKKMAFQRILYRLLFILRFPST
jgi:hypothetical protein